MLFLILICVTCIVTISVFIIYALLLFYLCKLYFTAIFYSCIMSVIFVMSLMLVWCFDFDPFHVELSVDRCWICKICECACARVRVCVCRKVGRYVCCFNHPQKWQLLGAKFGMTTGCARHFHGMWRTHCWWHSEMQRAKWLFNSWTTGQQ